MHMKAKHVLTIHSHNRTLLVLIRSVLTEIYVF